MEPNLLILKPFVSSCLSLQVAAGYGVPWEDEGGSEIEARLEQVSISCAAAF